MAAQRCSQCGVNYPLGYMTCQVCGDPLDRIATADIDDDWQIQVTRRTSLPAAAAWPVTDLDRVENWRLEQALRLGYPVDVAESIAADTLVDMNLLRVLVERQHVPLELAARIA